MELVDTKQNIEYKKGLYQYISNYSKKLTIKTTTKFNVLNKRVEKE